MKTALVLLALVAASVAYRIPNVGTGELAKELQDFLDIMPHDEIHAITLQYLSEDAEFQQMIKYLKSAEFKDLLKEVQVLPEIKVLMDYIQNAGVDIYYLVNKLNEFVGLPPLASPSVFGMEHITGGIKGYIKDIESILPKKQIKAIYQEKLKTSTVFRNFVDQLSSKNFQEIVNKVYVNPKFQVLLRHANEAGVNLIRIKNLLKKILNIDVPSYRLY